MANIPHVLMKDNMKFKELNPIFMPRPLCHDKHVPIADYFYITWPKSLKSHCIPHESCIALGSTLTFNSPLVFTAIGVAQNP